MPEYLQNIPKFYRNQQADDLTNAVIVLDSTSWKAPKIMSIENFGEKIKIVIDESYLKNLNIEQSLVIQKYNDQESKPLLPPVPDVKIQKTYMTNDENYLYIWIETSNKWKRIPMSNW